LEGGSETAAEYDIVLNFDEGAQRQDISGAGVIGMTMYYIFLGRCMIKGLGGVRRERNRAREG
jgi:hypothetical protein